MAAEEVAAAAGATGGLLGGLGSVLGSVFSYKSDFANAQMAWNNYQQEQNVFDYQRKLQRELFYREDNAMQRRVADLKAAGLSPALAYGGSGAGAGAPISVKAPKMEMAQRQFPRAITSTALAMQDLMIQSAQYDLLRQQVKNAKVINDTNSWDLKVAKDSGLPVRNTSAVGKVVRDVKSLVGKRADEIEQGFSKDHPTLYQLYQKVKKAHNERKKFDYQW